MQIGQSLQDGLPHREIAERYRVSEDSVQRHRRHLDAAMVNAKTDSFAEKWHQIYARADEIFASMNVQGDARAALQALQQQANALETGMRLHKEAGESASMNPETMSEDELYDWVWDRSDGRIPIRWLDRLMREAGEEIHGGVLYSMWQSVEKIATERAPAPRLACAGCARACFSPAESVA